MGATFIPGRFLTIDGGMIKWTACTLDDSLDGLPHAQHIPRKPEPVGCELKMLADGETRIILRVELIEGKEADALKEFREEAKMASTALVLRLVKDYFRTSRVVIGDSAFSSVHTLRSLSEKGLFYIGVIKTATRNFPYDHIKAWGDAKERRAGDFMVLKSDSEEHMCAIGHVDVTWKAIIFNVYTTIPVEPKLRKYKKVVVQDDQRVEVVQNVEVIRPEVVFQLFDNFSAVDEHNSIRQARLALLWSETAVPRLVGTVSFTVCLESSFPMHTCSTCSRFVKLKPKSRKLAIHSAIGSTFWPTS